MVNPDGNLEYVLDGKSQGSFTKAPAGFSAGKFLNLAYTVDPVSKKLLKLEYAGSDRTAGFHAKFPANFGASAIAGFLGSTAENPECFGRVDNFLIATGWPTAVPSGK